MNTHFINVSTSACEINLYCSLCVSFVGLAYSVIINYPTARLPLQCLLVTNLIPYLSYS